METYFHQCDVATSLPEPRGNSRADYLVCNGPRSEQGMLNSLLLENSKLLRPTFHIRSLNVSVCVPEYLYMEVRVCVSKRVFVWVCKCMKVGECVGMCVYAWRNMCLCVCLSEWVNVCVHEWACECECVYECINMHVHVCVCMPKCVWVWIECLNENVSELLSVHVSLLWSL